MFQLRHALVSIPLMLLVVAAGRAAAAEAIDFDRHIAPLLAAHCLECHNPTDRKGKFDLTSAAGLRKGGESGEVVVAGKPGESLLWEYVEGDEMPPKKPLNAAEKALIKAWIEGGGAWGKTDPIDRYAYSTDARAGGDFWSLQPVRRPTAPVVKREDWAINPIDAFVLARLEESKLSPAPPAAPRVLIRRAYFDLIGLPPTPKEIDDFVAECASDGGDRPYERLIDRLLASPHYGERWARHWLDVARYTESQGFEYDRFRPNAWRYRDYVINAFNSDKPYDTFIREQIAGDVIEETGQGQGGQEAAAHGAKHFPAGIEPSSINRSASRIIATSLLVCGPWDQAGSSQANLTQRMITREEELEDLVSVIGQTFLGLTVNCARCHSHKFDPITQEDYYRIKSAFEGVKHGERTVDSAAVVKQRQQQAAALRESIAGLRRDLVELETSARKAAATVAAGKTGDAKPQVTGAIARWTFDVDAKDAAGAMHGELVGGATIRDGRLIVTGDKQFMRSAPLTRDVREKTLEAWVALPTLDQGGGGVITLEASPGAPFDSIVYGERQRRKWIAGSESFVRTRDLAADEETAGAGELIHMVIVYAGDGTITLYRNGKRYAEPYKQDSLRTYKAGDGHAVLGMRHTGGFNAFLKGEIDAAALYDRALTSDEVAALHATGPEGGPVISIEQMLAAMSAPQRAHHAKLTQQIAAAGAQLAALPTATVAYVGLREQPRPTRRLDRGDVRSPAEVIAPAGLAVIKSPNPDFGLKPDAPEGQRRLALANWIADPRHPLTARVMINRIWHHHFGRGIVETPSDFGFSGGRPSHPQLLDWLAAQFVATGAANPSQATQDMGQAWSIKRMHKLIMMSATYRQSSQFNERAAAIDADNALLWRFAPRRLEGEIVRDAMLAVSGQLNRQLGGPSFKPFNVISFNSDFYELTDPIGPQFNRRSIYRANVQSAKSAMMDALDCPDPSIKTPARRVTTTPLAALALMNNSFVQRQAEHFSQRMLHEAGGDVAKAIGLAYEVALGRAAEAQEMNDALALVKKHDLKTFCWVLLNASEFMYVN